jgi:hypothetical protein
MRAGNRRKFQFAVEGLEGRNSLSAIGGVVTNVAQGLAFAPPPGAYELNPQPLPPRDGLTVDMSLDPMADDLNPQPLPP